MHPPKPATASSTILFQDQPGSFVELCEIAAHRPGYAVTLMQHLRYQIGGPKSFDKADRATLPDLLRLGWILMPRSAWSTHRRRRPPCRMINDEDSGCVSSTWPLTMVSGCGYLEPAD